MSTRDIRSPLTKREAEALRYVGLYKSDKEIAVAMVIQPGVVRLYMHSAITKLGARSRYEAYDIAVRAGWIERP